MAGLLDNKSRLLDIILTSRGRSQAMTGGLKFRYATVNDNESSYDSDNNGIAIQSAAQIGFESHSSPWDDLTITTNDDDYLISFVGDDIRLTPSGRLIQGNVVQVDDVADLAIESSLQSFKNLRSLSTLRVGIDDEGLSIEPDNAEFTIADRFPFDGLAESVSIDDVEGIFADYRFTNSPNFLFLPPVQPSTAAGDLVPLGEYENLREAIPVPDGPVPVDLSQLEESVHEFSRETERNTLCIQLFEESSDGHLQKLDIIPWGQVGVTREGKQKTLYFVGKTFIDGFDVPTFVNMFTLVLE